MNRPEVRKRLAGELLELLDAAEAATDAYAAARATQGCIESSFWRGYVSGRLRDMADRLVTE